jgi:molybdopterin adenylyltransferase
VPTAILSRQVGVIRKQALILNLPGQPKSIKETLEGVKAEMAAWSCMGSLPVYRIVYSYWMALISKRCQSCSGFSPKSARRETIS